MKRLQWQQNALVYQLVARNSFIRAFVWKEGILWYSIYVLGGSRPLKERYGRNKRDLMREAAKAVREAGY